MSNPAGQTCITHGAGGAGLPHVVIVGGGFGGLSAARALKNAPVRVSIIDRTNHHLFQPLLYQVATALLPPGSIAAPIREILSRQANVSVFMGEVIGVDADTRRVFADFFDRGRVPIAYDYLILATGVHHSYFGRDEFERFAPGLKSLADAVAIRSRMLAAFEQAETLEDPNGRAGLMTFVIVGAGPTGVELAAAIATFIAHTVEAEFRRIHPRWTKVVLIAPKVLPSFCPKLSAAAHRRLTRLGVDVRLGDRVDLVDEGGVTLRSGERIAARTVLWAAGVAPSPAGKWLNAETDRAGRVRVRQDLTLAAHPEVFVVGDTAVLEQDGKPLPGVAQVAIQQGAYSGKRIGQLVSGVSKAVPFRYRDKGNMAIVGPHFAVLETPRFQWSGLLAWWGWLWVHLRFLARRGLRLNVFVQWMWVYATGQRSSRLIVNHRTGHETLPGSPETVAAVTSSTVPARSGSPGSRSRP